MEGGSNGWSAVLAKAPAHAGTDFIITRDGRIAAVYLFFGKLPWVGPWRTIALAGGTGDHGDLTIARMSRFSKTTAPRSADSRTAVPTIARAKSSAGITWLGNSTRNTG